MLEKDLDVELISAFDKENETVGKGFYNKNIQFILNNEIEEMEAMTAMNNVSREYLQEKYKDII
jgi:hypothetical protein